MMRRSRRSASGLSAAVQRNLISPEDQRLTLRCVRRTISIIDSHGLVDSSVCNTVEQLDPARLAEHAVVMRVVVAREPDAQRVEPSRHLHRLGVETADVVVQDDAAVCRGWIQLPLGGPGVDQPGSRTGRSLRSGTCAP